MPPPNIKTLRDLIYWQYSKIIANSAGAGKNNYAFIMDRFKKLKEKEISWNEIREYIKERDIKECIFCGSKDKLTLEHLFPRSLNGPDNEKNIIWICSKCNSSKNKRRLYEWWTSCNSLKSAKYDIPRIAEGKYLKFLYEILKENNMLDLSIDEIKTKICKKCDLKDLCKREKSEGKLSPLCLEGIVTICLSTNK